MTPFEQRESLIYEIVDAFEKGKLLSYSVLNSSFLPRKSMDEDVFAIILGFSEREKDYDELFYQLSSYIRKKYDMLDTLLYRYKSYSNMVVIIFGRLTSEELGRLSKAASRFHLSICQHQYKEWGIV